MSQTIDKMAAKFKDLAELQQYCNSQYQLIIELSKKVNSIEEERDQLKKLLKDGNSVTPVLTAEAAKYSDEEAICRAQLRILREMSNDRDLSLEETKKVEIYTKLLTSLTTNKPEEKPRVQDFSNENLLTLLTTPANEQSK